jgi:hypothetical protein
MDVARKKLVTAMVNGNTLLIQLGASAPDFLGALCSPETLPEVPTTTPTNYTTDVPAIVPASLHLPTNEKSKHV